MVEMSKNESQNVEKLLLNDLTVFFPFRCFSVQFSHASHCGRSKVLNEGERGTRAEFKTCSLSGRKHCHGVPELIVRFMLGGRSPSEFRAHIVSEESAIELVTSSIPKSVGALLAELVVG